MRNNLLISLVLAASASSVFAMPYDPMKHCGIFEVALTGGGFQADTDNTGYGVLASGFNGAAPTYPTGTMLRNDPKYKFGGTVLLGYYFPESTYNVDLSYTGVRNHIEDGASGSIGVGLMGEVATLTTSTTNSTYHFNYDYVNLEVGSLTRVNLNGLLINPQVGLSYGRLKHNQYVTYLGGVAPAATNAGAVERESSFNGFGPSIGFDLNYIVCQPVTLSGSFRYNALVGNVDSFYTIRTALDADIAGVTFDSQHTVVSLFQSELALGYDFNISNMFCGNLAIGYQLTKAIDSAEQLTFISGDSAFATNSMNNSVQGYFLRLTMDFNV